MSRRRPNDDACAAAEGTLPVLSDDLANGKRRTGPERVSRFVRTRPVSALLLALLLVAAASLTYTVGRSVGNGLALLLFRSPRAAAAAPLRRLSHALSDSAAHRAAPPNASAVAPPPRAAADARESPPRAQGRAPDDGGHAPDPAAADPVADDERGALVDGIDDAEGIPQEAGAAAPGAEARPDGAARPHLCHRKFEPGKLGSHKTLCVTDEFFFDMAVGEDPIGTIKIGVFGDVVPKSVANFRALVTCSGVFADESLCYKGDSFHRIVSDFVAQGGSKATGRSIYGPTFREEKEKDHHSFLEHGEKGVVSWAEYPIGSQFFILIRDEAKYLDGNHVVFGVVTEGMDVLDKMHRAPRQGEQPTNRITIKDCGDAHKRI